ncbi:hypothetical protein HFO42_25925 [Rhizobium leguminosarum]|uniref:Lipoprotein n=2 Tax=Rhizobium leguminosarum TaxID=384 RepID=A0AAJ1ACI2_RHILE|nr:hypothetical protein [Rhizobium leguminosarum]MBY5597958.1 hypothetical protein [Rhizobium leguminosarum]MBY5617952.1 hypothetical protein [Rhizobium leguminosarum]MBY5631498.1 hypothetical protein [Rhizobium leguminosarum]
MLILRLLLLTMLAVSLASCGTFVPSLRDWPNNLTDAQSEEMVQAIVRAVRCELRNAVTTAVNDDLASAKVNGDKPYSDFLDNWGAEVALTLTIVEKSTVGPNGDWTPPARGSSVFTLGGSVSLSSQATRIEKMNFFYTMRELYLRPGQTCDFDRDPTKGSLLVTSDLKIASLLSSRITSVALGQTPAPAPGRQNVLSHEVAFQIVSTGNLNLGWTLARANINPNGGPLFSASRDRTHDLLVTFGPLDKAQLGQSLIAIAEQSHFTSQITSGVSNGLNSALRQ